MNLQLVSPYQKCSFNCPFCVAASDREQPQYYNLYEEDRLTYFSSLLKVLDEEKIETVVFTGNTEPTLFDEWLSDCAEIIGLSTNYINLELQTKNYNYSNDEDDFETVAYSMSTINDVEIMLNKLPHYTHNCRLVFLLNKFLDFDYIYYVSKRIQNCEMTVKIMQDSALGVKNVDEWIDKNKKTLTCEDIKLLTKNGVRVDEDCMNAENRYKIFGIDGKVYNSWEDMG